MLKLFDVGFGESVLLSNKNDDECMLVDCGSESSNKTNIFDNILKELNTYVKKTAVITHFHNDHINGFIHIINKEPHMFDTVYIPNIFSPKISIFNNISGFSIVDLEIVKYILENMYCNRNKTLSILDLLKSLVKSNANIKVIERGDLFNEIDNEFAVLWPNPEYLISNKIKNAFNKNPIFNDAILNEIHNIADQINEQFAILFNRENYLNFEDATHNQFEMIEGIEQRIRWLTDNVSNEITLNIKTVDAWIDRIKRIENNTSIVFQSEFNDSPVLLTGDIGNSIMKKICEDKYTPSVKIMDKYKVIKAPHHGTDCNHFLKFDVYTKYENIAISNGETNITNRGKISINYTSKFNSHRIDCTNSINDRCQYFSKYSKCCKNADICNLKKYIGDIKIL